MATATARLIDPHPAPVYGPVQDLHIDDGGPSATRLHPGLLAGLPPSTPQPPSEQNCEAATMVATGTDNAHPLDHVSGVAA